jgi:uncharacterized protein (DUF2336 family)
MALTTQAVLSELDSTLARTSESWRSTALRQIVDLFLSGARSYTGPQIALFDAVIGKLMTGADRLALAELSERLAPVPGAPPAVLVSLAGHPDVAVCGPVLAQAALPDKELAEIADRERADQNVLAGIAARRELSETVTDALLKRGGLAVQRAVIDDPSARISEAGFARLIMGLGGNKELAQAVAARNDVPAELRLWLTDALNA